jgi:CubicO group peptidase (beta-lactamase class C family)
MKSLNVALVAGLALLGLAGAWYGYKVLYLRDSKLEIKPGPNLETKLDQYVQAFVDQGTFSGSVLVAKDGKILLCKGYGMANYELDVPNTPQTKFRLASVSKQFTAMAIMQLQEKGLLNVNDTLSKYIPDYPDGDKITLHHLLTHTSGIFNYSDLPELREIEVKPHAVEQVIQLFKNKPLSFRPGEKYSYSNSGYTLLAYIIEKVSGKTYETVLQEQIFGPIGMYNSGYDKASLVLKNRASGYVKVNEELANAPYIDMSSPAGDEGLLYSTVEDMYLWDRALYTDKLVSRKSLETIFAPHIRVTQQIPDADGYYYGYGWFNRKCCGGHTVVEHNGGIGGFFAQIHRCLDDDVCVIVLSNFDHMRAVPIGRGLAAILFGEKYVMPQKYIAV